MNCYYVASDQPRYVRNRHTDLHDEDDTCRGCVPCTERHCIRCNREHVEQLVCPGCIADARDDLAEIGRLCAALPAEVVHRGINSEAMNLLGPVADPESVGHVRASINVGRIDAGWLEEADNEHHPLLVLGGWGECYIEALDHDEPERWTVASAASYLDRNLAYVAQLDDVPFEDLARDLSACRNHIERVLHDGEQVEIGAPCMTCGGLLRRIYGGDPLPWSYRDGSRPLAGDDGWACGRCRELRSETDYRLNVAEQHQAKADRLTLRDLAQRIGVPEKQVRKWVTPRRVWVDGAIMSEPPRLRPCGTLGGRNLYRVADAEALVSA